MHLVLTLCTIYNVQLFADGNILAVGKHGLAKGLPDDFIILSYDMYNRFSISKEITSSECADNYCLLETFILDLVDGSKLDVLLSDISYVYSFSPKKKMKVL